LEYIFSIDNSFSKIDPLLPERIRLKIDKKTSFLNKSKSFYLTDPDWLAYEHLFSYESQFFPTGLGKEVASILKEENISFKILDKRKVPPFSFNRDFSRQPYELRPYQEEIVKRCLKYRRGVVESVTGSGKTLMALHLINKLRRNVLFIVPTINIAEQTHFYFSKHYPKNTVGFVGGGNFVVNPITIALPQSLLKLPLDFFKKFGCLMIDESHHASALTIRDLNYKKFNGIYFRYFLTGTNFRNDGSDLALKGTVGNVIASYGIHQAIREKFLVAPVFRIYFFHSENNQLKNVYSEEYKQSLVYNDDYHKVVASLGNKLLKQGKQTIIFVEEIAHGKILNKLIPGSYFICGERLSNNNREILQKFNKKEIKLIIGTSVIGEGVDTVPAEYGIFAGGGKAKSEVIQRIGRLLRPSPGKKNAYIIDFAHVNTNFLFKHYQQRLSIYKAYNSFIDHKHISAKELNK